MDQNQNYNYNQPPVAEKKRPRSICSGFGSTFGGFALIILGGYFLGREYGWFDYDFPFWAVFLILAGLWMVVSALRK